MRDLSLTQLINLTEGLNNVLEVSENPVVLNSPLSESDSSVENVDFNPNFVDQESTSDGGVIVSKDKEEVETSVSTIESTNTDVRRLFNNIASLNARVGFLASSYSAATEQIRLMNQENTRTVSLIENTENVLSLRLNNNDIFRFSLDSKTNVLIGLVGVGFLTFCGYTYINQTSLEHVSVKNLEVFR